MSVHSGPCPFLILDGLFIFSIERNHRIFIFHLITLSIATRAIYNPYFLYTNTDHNNRVFLKDKSRFLRQ